jgi:hypothetical protein
VNVLPCYALIAFGSFCLARLGLDLLTFNDYPEQILVLEKEIKLARKELENMGVYK